LHIMNKRFNRRAVSEIIAALLLIAIAVSAAILLYVFAIGLVGSLYTTGGIQTKEQIIMEAYNFPSPGNTLTVTVRNVGPTTENLARSDYFINGIAATVASFSCGAASSALTPGQPCTITLTLSASVVASLMSDVSYPFKMVTPTGGVFSYPVIYGGAA